MLKKKKIYGICDRCGGIREFRRYRGKWECQNCRASYDKVDQVPVEVMTRGDSPRHY